MFFLSLFELNLLVILLTGLAALYFYLTRNFNYWSSRGVKGPKPIVFFGTIYKIFSKPLKDINEENAQKYGKIYGGFIGTRPVLIVGDPELVKQMNIRDFHLFVDRNDLTSGDVLNDRSLFNLHGEEWKTMRSIISPTFSSGKMRSMHPLMVDCVHRLEDYLHKKTLNTDVAELEMKKVMSSLTMDVIASCAFGTKTDTYNDEIKSEFLANAQKVFQNTWRFWLFFMLKTTFPKLLDWTGFQITDPGVAKFFRTVIRSIVSQRKASKGKHRDYLQLMINAQNKTLEVDEQDLKDENKEEIFGQLDEKEFLKINKLKEELTEDDLLANSFLFFVAGYETTASLLSFVFYSLALNEKCQQKLYEEVKSYNGNYDYESIAQMHYLEACVAETLRLYNPVSAVGRMAAEDYELGDTGIKIPKGMLVNFDVQTLHHSPDYWPNPDVWSPERFMPENRDQLTPYTYMPFGMGPRNCVGMRFALMEAKTAIAYLVYKFEFFRTANTTVPLKPKKFQFLLNMGDINIGFKLRNK